MLERWNPPIEPSTREKNILKLCKKQKLWSFFRLFRHRLLDEEIWQKLRSMYAQSGRGSAVQPEQMVLAMLLQILFHKPDHEIPALTACDQRWRMVLGSLGQPEEQALFKQGSVFNFRERARANGLMTFLLEKTVLLAKETKAFSPKRLKVLIDSSPLVGAGRIEDTINLIGRAIGQLVNAAAKHKGQSKAELAEQLDLTVVSAKSVKAALDLDWRDKNAKNEALQILLSQLEQLRRWLSDQFTKEELSTPPLSDSLAQVQHLVDQDTEPDPQGPEGSSRRIKKGGEDRQMSLSDPDMRFGRKCKSKGFAGYKRHALTDAEVSGLFLSVEVLAGNVREHEAAKPLLLSVENQGFAVEECQIDRGYLSSALLHERRQEGLQVVSKPPTAQGRDGRFGKSDFSVDLEGGLATCPGGQKAAIRMRGQQRRVTFSRPKCRACALKSRCLPKSGQKSLTLHEHEAFYQQMAQELSTKEGRQKRRERTAVEHALARLGSIQGTKARYRGLEKNQFHTEASAVVANLHVLNQLWSKAA